MGKVKFNRTKFFLTYSCPVDKEDNPITGRQELLDFLSSVPPENSIKAYSVAEELHKNGKRHYHAYIEYDTAFCHNDAVRVFDYEGVHPDILRGVPYRHIKYCAKTDDDVLTNCEGKVDHFKEAVHKRTDEDAITYLWEHEPKSMCVQGHNIERNIRRKLDPTADRFAPYYGPYREVPRADWRPTEKALIVEGDPGLGKTQWA